jgi:hypothetical protein
MTAGEHGRTLGVVETEDGKAKCLDCNEVASTTEGLIKVDCSTGIVRPRATPAEEFDMRRLWL